MRQDEVKLLKEELEFSAIHPKRLAYLIKKWVNKGWWSNKTFTKKGTHVKSLIHKTHNDSDYLSSLDRHVCILHTINWMPPVCGILIDYGDNGLHFFTKKVFKWPTSAHGLWSANGGYFLGDGARYMEACVAWIELHPNPLKLWHRFNHLAYLKNPTYNKDYWHQRGPYDWKTGNYLECLPTCQCKHLDQKITK